MSKIRLHGSSSGYMEIAPPAAGSSATITLPNSAGEVLLSDGSAASLTQIPAANIVGVCTSGLTKTGGFGKVLQVVTATKTDTASNSTASGASWTPTTPKCSITPSNANNKILVQATIAVALSADSHAAYLTVLKDGNTMFIGDLDGSNMVRTTVGTSTINDYNFAQLVFNYLDTAGGTSAIEYSLSLSHDSGATATIYINRTEATDNIDDRKRGASNIILTEIAA